MMGGVDADAQLVGGPMGVQGGGDDGSMKLEGGGRKRGRDGMLEGTTDIDALLNYKSAALGSSQLAKCVQACVRMRVRVYVWWCARVCVYVCMRVCVCVAMCVRVCMRMCAYSLWRACMHACARGACARECVSTHARVSVAVVCIGSVLPWLARGKPLGVGV